jgi:two-component system, OmpR family, KDP operon response regulator KdpE
MVHAGSVMIDLANHLVTRNDEEVRLTATEFRLLAYLAAHAGRVLTHHMILTNVWDISEADRVEYLRVYLRQLRKKLEDDPDNPKILITEPGVGYRMITD